MEVFFPRRLSLVPILLICPAAGAPTGSNVLAGLAFRVTGTCVFIVTAKMRYLQVQKVE